MVGRPPNFERNGCEQRNRHYLAAANNPQEITVRKHKNKVQPF